MDDGEIRALATKRLKAKADFKNYLWVWLGVSVLLTAIWFIASPGSYFWPAWAIGGMGVAAFFQALGIYGPNRDVISESAIDAEVNKLKGNGPGA